ncbi:phage tail length tape measure family protein [Agrobacterium tumefaciens]|uniref:phage tail length tape measure family protein n=1 Tax=Agrobacterium tumefaciens TaxID=358 RepID=UPI0021CE8703|nr:phage tail length tape measure family protein [Agrobacterium tumefaciens]UXT96766.1 hypothetical protein FY129_04535 [Agrobacterium tumefaciens]
MATDNEQLVLSISADVRQIQRQLKGLVGQTQRDTKAIESAFGGIDKAASGAFNNVAANSNRAFTTAEQGARRYQNAMRSSTVQTSNLAAQLNDIGVQLAGGQSPFLIALQQGTQISQALGSGVGARGAVSALAGAFTSLLNPVSLATIAIIGLGGEAIQYFATLLSSGEKSADVLEKQAELIRNIAKEWGDTIPAIREYADELERAQKIAALQQGAEVINSKTLADVREELGNVETAFADALGRLQEFGQEYETVKSLQDAFNQFAAAAADGSLKIEDVKSVQDRLSSAIESTGIPALDSFKVMFDNLSASALAAAGSVQKLNAETGAATTALYPSQGAYGGVERSADGNIQNGGFMTPEDGPTPERRPLIELEGLPGRKGGKTRDAAAEKIKREKEAVVELIAQLQFEQDMIGATDVERAKANALRQAGAVATEEQRAKIAELVEQTYAEREAILASKDAMLELQDASRDVLQGIVSDLRDGKNGADILANALDRIASRLLDSAFDGLFSGGLGKGGVFGGKLIPGILHSGGIAGRDGYGHGRSVSPSVFAGAPRYHNGGIAGLKPDEVPAILQKGERIIPRNASSSGGSPVAVSFAPVYNVQGSGPEIAQLRAQMAKDKAEMPARVEAAVRSAQKRNVKLG